MIYAMQNINNKDAWWKPGMVLLTQISSWIVAPMVVALVFGKMLDAHYGTRPVIFLIFAGLGFLFTCFGILKVMQNYIKELKKIESAKLGTEEKKEN